MLEHETLGVIDYVWPRFWPRYWDTSRRAAQELLDLQTIVEQVAPHESTGVRHVPDEVRDQAIDVMARMVIAAVLTIRYFVLEVERVSGARPSGGDDDLSRLRSTCRSAGMADPAAHKAWSLVGELVDVRHRVEHPEQITIYSSDSWERVPLAWAFTEHALVCFDAFVSVFRSTANEWEERKKVFEAPGTVQVAERGLTSRRPPKKPRSA